ncbi:MAG TPA: hypothetical protein VI959_04280, partial [Alphaproteobacteria bacterium]|nr:hypothetical protein [Alphaproteobacteria bacterium]
YLLSEENWTVLLNKFGLKVDLLSDDENFLSKCFVVSKNKDIQPGNNEADQKKFSVLKNEACNYQQLVDEKIKNKVLQYGLYANSQRELHPFCAVVYNSEQELLSNKMFDIEFAKYLSKKIKESKEYHHKIHNIQFENESNNILRQSGFDPNNPLVASLKKLLKK